MMTRITIAAFLVFPSAFILCGQEKGKPPEEPKLRKLDPGDEKPRKRLPPDLGKEPGLQPNPTKPNGTKDGKPSADDPKVIMARIAENLEKSEQLLKEKDISKKTLDIQQKIIEDLEKLIKQKESQSSQQQGASGSPKPGQKPSGNSRPQSGSGSSSQKQGKPSSGSQGGKPKDKKESGGKGKSSPQQQDKKGEKAGSKQQKPGKKAGSQDSKSPAGTGIRGVPQGDPKITRTKVPDLRSQWGHLPKRKLDEIDAYSRERFMPRYDQLLRQYYRAIAERAKRGEDDR